MYTFISQFTSPNSTPGNQTRSVWGVDRNVTAIAIHWWGDPSQNPTFEGVVSYLCRPNGNSSAHFVATGTARRVACIVEMSDNAWATNNANPYTIAIECDPRCRDEDYDVVGELVAEIRSVYGNLPLVPHKQFTSTTCPGNYDLNRINQVASTKIARPEDQFGLAQNKAPSAPVNVNLDQLYALYREILERDPDQSGIDHFVGKYAYDFVKNDLLNSQERKDLIARKDAAQKAAVEAAKAEADAKAAKEAADKEAKRIADEKAAQDKAKELAEAEAKRKAAEEAEKNKTFIRMILDTIIAYFRELLNAKAFDKNPK